MNVKIEHGLMKHLARQACCLRHGFDRRFTRCRKKCSEKNVHALRVEIRRILALLELLEHASLITPCGKLQKKMKESLDCFDPLRDAQVQLAFLEPLWPGFPEAEDIKELLLRRKKALRLKLRHKIKRVKHERQERNLKKIEKHLFRCLKGDAGVVVADRAVVALRQSFERVARLRQHVRPTVPATIHQLRVAFKRFRYTCELLQQLIPPQATSRWLRRMKEYQDAAGGIQDVVVLLRSIKKFVRAGRIAPEAVRNLRRDLLRRKRNAIELFMGRIDELFEFEPAVFPSRFAAKARGRVQP